MLRRHLLAVLAATVALGVSAATPPPGQDLVQVQLLPTGEFAARDGRPGPGQKWRLDDARGHALSAAVNAVAAQTPLVIDYEHQTLTAMQGGHKAPAAGWIHRTTWLDGRGLFGDVKWTAAAAGHIKAEEYRYLSPVIVYSDDGQVTGLHMAALVNFPALLGMEPAVAALSAFSHQPQPEHSMDLAQLLALIGLTAAATPAEITAHVAALKARPEVMVSELQTALGVQTPTLQAALSAVTALKAPTVPAALHTALGLQTPDLQAALSAVEALKGGAGSGVQAMAALQGQVAALTGQINESKVQGLVDQALKENKLLPAQRDWALGLGKSDFPQLQAYLSSAVAIPGLGGQTLDGQQQQLDGTQTAALTGAAALVAAQLGLDQVKFAEQIQAAA